MAKSRKNRKVIEDAEEIGASLPKSEATESFIEKVTENAEATIAAETAPEAKKVFTCVKCGREFKSEGFYIVHERDCTGPKPKRVKLTEEQKAERRKVYLATYLGKFTPISFRLNNESKEKALLDEVLAELKSEDPTAVYTTAVRKVLSLEAARRERRNK